MKSTDWLVVLVLAQGLTTATPGFAQSSDTTVTPSLRIETVAQTWSFFDPPPGGGDPSYGLLGNRSTLGVSVTSRRFDVQGAFRYSQLVGLPPRANVPGPLGPGAQYYDAARAWGAFQLYFKTLSARVKAPGAGLSVEAGRMRVESVTDAARSGAVAALERDRLGGRLIGEASWTVFERAFDGLRLDLDRRGWQANASLLVPTQGGFEESANPSMGRLRLLAASSVWHRSGLDAAMSASVARGFAHHYRDRRAVRGRPDNSGLSAAAANIHLVTLGGSHTGLYPFRRGRIDTIVWAALQTGDWYSDSHRAFSVLGEAGYRWRLNWHPWLRGGMLHASGDGQPGDLRHTTFFPMLPSTRPDVLASTVAEMNLRRSFVELRLQPRPHLTARAAVHRFVLAEAADRWYSGTGATAMRGSYFGFSTRPSGRATGLGTLFEAAAAGTLNTRWSMKGSIGLMQGGDVVRALFAGRRLFVMSFENVLTF